MPAEPQMLPTPASALHVWDETHSVGEVATRLGVDLPRASVLIKVALLNTEPGRLKCEGYAS